MFKFIHAADIHLDSPLTGLNKYEGAPADAIRQAARRAFERLVQLAVDERVAFVLLAGDLYDGDWRDYQTGLYFAGQLSRVHAAGIAVYLISGNHDAANRMTLSLELPPNPDGTPVMLSHDAPQTIRLEPLDVAIHGRGFPDAVFEGNAVLDYPAGVEGCYNIGLLHTSFDYESGGAHARYAPCQMSHLETRRYQYWALGHIHRRDDQRRTSAGAPVVFPGNIQGRHIREEGAKGCMVCTVSDTLETTLRFAPLDVFRWKRLKVDVTGASDALAVMKLVRGSLSNLLESAGDLPHAIRVEIEGRCPAHHVVASKIEHWTAQLRAEAVAIGGGKLWIEKVKFRTSAPLGREEAAALDNAASEVGAYLQELKEDDVWPAQFPELMQTFNELHQRLPPALQDASGDASLIDQQQLTSLLEEVEPLLLQRLHTSAE